MRDLGDDSEEEDFIFSLFELRYLNLFPSNLIKNFLYCMAAISKGQVIAGSFGKRLANQISAVKAKDPASIQRSSLRSVAYFSSSYDKNVDEHVRPAVVPDHVISSESDKYWCPHPKTGVFGPADSSSGVEKLKDLKSVF
ncbi:uncharacterized protein LOC109838349 [Asparagus officinalis]|uniref:uncharacterized protein LOC109838349 n=1 Tax=Asparagus officinalis TaxID=4686 RepID=UPI00098DECBD|nr:uncharacterized protein LOC109838349 [Asparagus officinalis]